MIMKNTNKGMMLAVFGLVGAVVLATPAVAQQGASTRRVKPIGDSAGRNGQH